MIPCLIIICKEVIKWGDLCGQTCGLIFEMKYREGHIPEKPYQGCNFSTSHYLSPDLTRTIKPTSKHPFRRSSTTWNPALTSGAGQKSITPSDFPDIEIK